MKPLACVLALAACTSVCRTVSAEETIEKAPFSCKPVAQINFVANTSEAHFHGTLERWQQDCFSFFAKKGQRVKVDVVDFNKSATLSLYKPGYKIQYGNYIDEGQYVVGWANRRIPINTYQGGTLTPSPESQETAVQTYSGRLPQTGSYLIVVELAESGASTFGGRLSIK